VLSVDPPQPVASAATLAPSCTHTSEARRLSEERPPELEGCDTSRRYQGDSRIGSGAPAEKSPIVYGIIDKIADLRENTVAKKRTAKPAES